MERLLTPKEAAGLLRLSPARLAQLRSEKKGPKYYKVGGSVRYALEDLEGYVKKGKITPEAA